MRMPLMFQIGRIFKRSETLPLERELKGGEIARVEAKRTSFFRPWAKRDAAIASLREGMESLAGTIVSIRDNLEKQGRRQDEMLQESVVIAHPPSRFRIRPSAHFATPRTRPARLHQTLIHRDDACICNVFLQSHLALQLNGDIHQPVNIAMTTAVGVATGKSFQLQDRHQLFLTLVEKPPLAGLALLFVNDSDDNKHRDLPFLIIWRSTRSATSNFCLSGNAQRNGQLDQVIQVLAVLGRANHGWASVFGFATTQPYGGSAFFGRNCQTGSRVLAHATQVRRCGGGGGT